MVTVDSLAGKIREVEDLILDKHHEGYYLLQRPQIQAVSHLLKVYGNLIRDFQSSDLSRLPGNAWHTELELWTRALEQALRWVLAKPGSCRSCGEDAWSQLDEQSLSLLSWARSYVKLVADHTAASRGHYVASCDEMHGEICFSFKTEIDAVMLTAQFASWPVHAYLNRRVLPEMELTRLFESWVVEVDLAKLNDPRSIPPLTSVHKSHEFQKIRDWCDQAILPELADIEDLYGFDLGQFRDFWAHLFTECQMVTRLEDHVDKVIGLENDLGSILHQDDADCLAEYFGQEFGIDKSVVVAILDCLTFDAESAKSTLTNSPFIRTSDNALSLLCRRAVTLDPNIMLSSGLAKRSRKFIYDRLINKIETYNVLEVAESFRCAGFLVLRQPALQGKNGQEIRPDLIIYEPATRQILIIDYKHALPPFGPAEVDNRLRDLREWTEQVRGYLHFARENQEALYYSIEYPIEAMEGMVLFRWPIAIPGSQQEDIIYADWPSLAVGLKGVEGISIGALLRFYRLARDTEQVLRQWTVGEETISVGQWTYRRPLIISRESPDSAMSRHP